MKYRALIVFPAVVAVVFVVLRQVFTGSPHAAMFLRVEVETVKAMALVGSLVAALRFRPADYLFRAWIFTAGCVFLLLTRDLTLISAFDFLGASRSTVQAVIVTLANVSQVVGAFFLARAWGVAGLDTGDHKGVRLVVVAVLTLAAAFALPGVWFEFSSVRSGRIEDVALMMSGAADLVSLVLIAPIVFTALALRGGLLGWPFGLFAASMLAWVGYDSLVSVGPQLGVPADLGRTLAEMFRGLGCTLTLSAGLAQRWVVEEARVAEVRKAA